MKWTPIKVIIFGLILVFYGSLLVHQIKLPAADDLGRHIKNGEVFFQTTDVLNRNLYSYTEPNQSFTNHHWLSGVIFYLVHTIAGFTGLVLFKTLILLISFSLIFITATKKADFWLVAALSLPTILILRERTDVRPEIFSIFFISAFIYLLLNFERYPSHKKIYLLIPLQLLWVNLHFFFSIGLMIVAGFLIEKIIVHRKDLKKNPIIRKLGIIFISMLIVCFINPHGVKGALYSYGVHSFSDYPISIGEDQSVMEFLRTQPYQDDVSVVLFIPLVILLILSFLLNYRKGSIFLLLASIGTIGIGFVMLRAMAFFGLIFLIATPQNINNVYLYAKEWITKKRPGYVSQIRIVFILVLLILFSYSAFIASQGQISKYRKPGVGLQVGLSDAVDFFMNHKITGPIFNDTDIGSYLIYHLYPQEKVFIDNRFGDAYSLPFFNDEYFTVFTDEKRWLTVLNKYNFNSIFFYHYNATDNARAFLARRMNDPLWRLVYVDQYSVILLKNNEKNKSVIEQFEITSENIEQRVDDLFNSLFPEDQIAAADVTSLMGKNDLAIKMYKTILERWPEKGRIWMILGEMELIINSNPLLAREYFEQALQQGHVTAEVHSFIGYAYYKSGDIDNAKKSLQKSLNINPDRADAKELMGIINTSSTIPTHE